MKHPGGQDILLGVAGRDATVEFETMRHSAIALQQMERCLGSIWKWKEKNPGKCDGFFVQLKYPWQKKVRKLIASDDNQSISRYF